MSRPPHPLALVGPMGSGKSAVGRVLARSLGFRFLDLDAIVEDREGRTVPELFAHGESRFRSAEAEAFAAILDAERGADFVLALGGGAFESSAIRDAAADRLTVVHLDADPRTLAARLAGGEVARRPLLAEAEDVLARLTEMRERRAGGYSRADISVDTSEFDVEAAALAVLRRLYGPPKGPWSEPPAVIGSPQGGAAGLVTIGRGALPELPNRRAVALVDASLPALQREPVLEALRVACASGLVVMEREGGEGCKTASSLEQAWSELLVAGVDRDTEMWVLGGGTITDLGGFVAHTYKRGLALRLLPTTLLAQLDAAIGGKNGINVGGTKNAAGTIRVPEHVHIDPLFLLTLDDIALRGGLAEALKSGLVGDAELANALAAKASALRSRTLPALEDVVARAVAVKMSVVEQDLHESGVRRVLNLGHTLGHALEALAARRGRTLPHGDAVAIGMVFAARLARREGALVERDLPERIHAAVAALGLPVRADFLERADVPELLEEMGRDKKRAGGASVWVLPVRVGEVVCRGVDTVAVANELEDFLA